MCYRRLKKESARLADTNDNFSASELIKNSYINARKYFIFEVFDENERSITGRLLPESDLYKSRSYRIKILYPIEYPFKQPKVIFITKIYHPNIDTNGEICSCKITEDEWKPNYEICFIIKFLIYLIDNPQPIFPIPFKGTCRQCNKVTQPCVKSTCLCCLYTRRKNLSEPLSELADASIICCQCKFKYLSYLSPEHQCTLDDMKLTHHRIMEIYGLSCAINEDVSFQYRHNQDEFIKTVKIYVKNFGLSRMREPTVLSLKQISKQVILDHVDKAQLNQLNVPQTLFNYLNE